MLPGSPDAVVRLGNIGERLGGSARVRKIKYYSVFEGDTVSHVLKYRYGPGVASFEPAYNHEENPFALPAFYKANRNNPVSSVMAWAGFISDPVYFQLGPVMRSAFPGASIGYQWVEVEHVTPSGVLSTGKTRYEYYTYKDYPVYEAYSPINAGTVSLKPTYVQIDIPIGTALSPYKYKMTYIAASQGHVAVIHNMHGKLKRKVIYDGSGRVIRREVYHYRPGSDGTLFVKPDGHLDTLYSGVDMDFLFHVAKYNRTNMSVSVQINMGGILWPLPPIPFVVPFGLANFNLSEFKGRAITATKRIYVHYFLEMTEIWDRTQYGYQKSYAYDLTTGEPLVQQVRTSISSPPVYTLKIPAYWQYERIASAHTLEGMVYKISTNGNGQIIANQYKRTSDPWYRQSAPLIPGDVLISLTNNKKVWVIEDEINGGLFLIDHYGNPVQNISGMLFIRVQSGNRNIFGVSTAEIQALSDPLRNGRLELTNNDPLLTASLTTFSDRWQLPCTKQCSLAQNAIETIVLGGAGNKIGRAFDTSEAGRIKTRPIESAVNKHRWLTNVLEYKGKDTVWLNEMGTRSVAPYGDTEFVRLILVPEEIDSAMWIYVPGKPVIKISVLHPYQILDARVRTYRDSIYVVAVIRDMGSIPPVYRVPPGASVIYSSPNVDPGKLYLALLSVKFSPPYYRTIWVGKLSDTAKTAFITSVRISDPGVVSYIVDIPYFASDSITVSRQIVGATQLNGVHLESYVSGAWRHKYLISAISDVLWHNGELLGAGTWFVAHVHHHLISAFINRYSKGHFAQVWNHACFVYEYAYDKLYDQTWFWMEAWRPTFIKRNDEWYFAGGMHGLTRFVKLNLPDTLPTNSLSFDSADVFKIGAGFMLPSVGNSSMYYPVMSRWDSLVRLLPLDTTAPCFLRRCQIMWGSIGFQPYTAFNISNSTLQFSSAKSQLPFIQRCPTTTSLSHAGCSCPDSAIVRIEHPKACCTGKITVLNNTQIKVWRYVSGNLDSIGSDTYFEDLCPGLYLIEPANPSHRGCRWREQISLDASMLCTGPNAGTVNPYVKGLRGRWMVHRQYVWRGARTPYDTSRTRLPHLRYEGTYHGWKSFFDYSSGKLKINPSGQGWYEASRVTQMGLWGEPVEEVNMLGITIAALFGYQRHLPVLVGSYTRLRNMFFSSFEEMEVLRSHVRLPDYYLDTLETRRTTDFAHTGYHSLYVPARDSFSIYGTTVRRSCNDIYEPRSVPFRVSGCDCMDPFSPEPGVYYYYAWVKWPTKVKWDTVCKPSFCLPINIGGGMPSVEINKDSMSALRRPNQNNNFPMSTIKPKCFCRWQTEEGGLGRMYKCCPVKRLIPVDPQVRLTVWWRGGSEPDLPPEYVSPPIDGWRLYRWKIRFPDECGKFGFKLTSGNGWHFWIDDVRLEPADSRSEAYVYDPAILRPVAKFGPPHGATIYRYDERGQLVTVLQEVERGLFGISHQRQNWNAK